MRRPANGVEDVAAGKTALEALRGVVIVGAGSRLTDTNTSRNRPSRYQTEPGPTRRPQHEEPPRGWLGAERIWRHLAHPVMD